MRGSKLSSDRLNWAKFPKTQEVEDERPFPLNTLSKPSPAPFDWIAKEAETLAGKAASECRVLDLACGSGRHGRCYLKQGASVTFLDRDLSGVEDLRDHSSATLIEADIEAGPWPFDGQHFARVIVTNYLWRPLLLRIVTAVAPGGTLLYQTFAMGNEAYGRPRNPDFLLREGELETAIGNDFDIVESFHGPVSQPKPAVIQRVHAVRRL